MIKSIIKVETLKILLCLKTLNKKNFCTTSENSEGGFNCIGTTKKNVPMAVTGNVPLSVNSVGKEGKLGVKTFPIFYIFYEDKWL